MKAWIKGREGLAWTEIDPPVPRSDALVVAVRAISLNRGEIRSVMHAGEGAVPGWDVAGLVVEAAASGDGPSIGTRVAALVAAGGWAERVRVPVAHAAVVPDGVELEVAATLPIAGLTVMRSLAVAGSLVGGRALVTGGAGGVGQLAVQLAALAGASVTAVSSDPERHPALRELGASATARSVDDAPGPFDLVLESVGGDSLARAIDLVAPGGVVVTIGNSAERETTFNARALYAKGGASIYGLLVFEELASRRVTARHLERLLALVAAGRLRAPIGRRASWRELPAALAALEAREVTGKVVLSVD